MFRRHAVAALAILLAGCASQPAAEGGPTGVTAGPPPGKAVIVFLRPSALGADAQVSLFDVSGERPVLIGIVPVRGKIGYVSDAGRRRFMVLAQSADFMDAELVAGRIYYARIAARIDGSAPHFALQPMAPRDAELALQLAECSWTTSTGAQRRWAEENMASIETKKAAALPAWLAQEDRPLLKASPP